MRPGILKKTDAFLQYSSIGIPKIDDDRSWSVPCILYYYHNNK